MQRLIIEKEIKKFFSSFFFNLKKKDIKIEPFVLDKTMLLTKADFIFFIVKLIFFINIPLAISLLFITTYNSKENFVYLNLLVGFLLTGFLLIFLRSSSWVQFLILTICFNWLFNVFASDALIKLFTDINTFEIKFLIEWFKKQYGFFQITDILKTFYYFYEKNNLILKNLNENPVKFNVKPERILKDFKNKINLNVIFNELENNFTSNENLSYFCGESIKSQTNLLLVFFKTVFFKTSFLSFLFISKIFFFIAFIVKFLKKFLKIFTWNFYFLIKFFKVFLITINFMLNLTYIFILWTHFPVWGESVGRSLVILYILLWFLVLLTNFPILCLVWFAASPIILENSFWTELMWNLNKGSSELFFIKNPEMFYLPKCEKKISITDRILTKNLFTLRESFRVFYYQIFYKADYFAYKFEMNKDTYHYKEFKKFDGISEIFKFFWNFLKKNKIYLGFCIKLLNYVAFFILFMKFYKKKYILFFFKKIIIFFYKTWKEIQNL